MRKPGSAAEWEQKRMTAANMFEMGLGTGVIARAVGADGQTVARWRRAFEAEGREGLRSRPHPGRPPRLSDEQRRRLAGLLVKAPRECGFADHNLWTQQLIADLIAREFGVAYHHDHVGVILRALGFTHQKPARRARERDEARIEAWRRTVWPELLKKAPRPAG
jgi:transposase